MAEIKVPLPTNEQMEELKDKAYTQSTNSIRSEVINTVEVELTGYKKDFILICDITYEDVIAGNTMTLLDIDTTIYKEIDLMVFNSMDSGVPEPVQISLRNRVSQTGWLSFLDSNGEYKEFYRIEVSSGGNSWLVLGQKYPDLRKIVTNQLQIMLRYVNQPTNGLLKIFLIGVK